MRDHDVPPPRQGLEIRAEGLWCELFCETPGDHWTCGLEAFAVRLDTPDDALRAGGEIGERVPVGLDLEWEAPEIVHGDVLVGREQWTIDGARPLRRRARARATRSSTVSRWSGC